MEITIQEKLEKMVADSKKDGKRRKELFSKDKFVREFPQMASDPRIAFTPDEFFLDVTPLEGVSVKELRELCMKCGEHERAVRLALNVQALAEDRRVYILKEDLNFLHVNAKGSPPVQPVSPQPQPQPKPDAKEKPAKKKKE